MKRDLSDESVFRRVLLAISAIALLSLTTCAVAQDIEMENKQPVKKGF